MKVGDNFVNPVSGDQLQIFDLPYEASAATRTIAARSIGPNAINRTQLPGHNFANTMPSDSFAVGGLLVQATLTNLTRGIRTDALLYVAPYSMPPPPPTGNINNWTNSVSDFWFTAANWSQGAPSLTQALIQVTNSLSKTVSYSSGTIQTTISNLLVSAPLGSTNTVNVSMPGIGQGNFTILNSLTISSGGALVINNNGALHPFYLGPGYNFIDDGGVTLTSVGIGKFVGTNVVAVIGSTAAGSGQMTVSNSTFIAYGAIVGSLGRGTFTVTSAGQANLSYLVVGDQSGASGTVWVAGGLVVTNYSTFVGSDGVGQMTLTNGASFVAHDIIVGGNLGQGTLTIAGGVANISSKLSLGSATIATGTVWVTGGELDVTNAGASLVVGEQSVGALTVSNGLLQTGNLILGRFSAGRGIVRLSGGSILASITQVNRGTLTIAGGSLTADVLIATNGFIGIGLNAGQLNCVNAAFGGASQFVDGDGTNAATYHLLGGTHTFPRGLLVRTNATLSGCGAISGTVVVDPGGTVRADCGGALTFYSSVTNNGIMHAENGSVLVAYGIVVNNGLIDIMDGTINFAAGLTNNGIVVDASFHKMISTKQQGNDINITWATVGGRSYVVQTNAPSLSGSYTNDFADFSPPILIPGTTLSATNFLDVGAATNKPARYYRVRLVP